MSDLTPVTVTTEVPDAPQYTAAGDADLAINNPWPGLLKAVITDDTTPPAIEKFQFGISIKSGRTQGLTLLDGQSLWIVATNIVGRANITVGIQD